MGVDEPSVTIARGTYTNLVLDFKMSVGSITLKEDSSAQYLAKVANRVYLRRGTDAEFGDAEEVEYSEIDSKTVRVRLNSADEGMQVNYAYEITITISNNISLQIDFDCGFSSGGTDFTSSLGSTDAIRGEIYDQTTIITSLDLSGTTGGIDFEIGGTVPFSDPFPSIETSTGYIRMHLGEVYYTTSTTWDISTSAGKMNLYIWGSSYRGLSGTPFIRTHTFNVESSTGDIYVDTDHSSRQGLKVVVKTDSPSKISIPDDLELTASTISSSTYTSINYTLTDVKYDFIITVSTGNITVITNI